MKRSELKARPIGHDYRAEIQQRFGTRAHLCDFSYLDSNPQERKPYDVSEGIAIIEISGVLSNDAYWWDESEYGEIQDEAKMAGEDPDVLGIVLRINSPGGSTDNAFETAQVLQDVGKKKPMWAVADNIAYSAGFLLASTAAKIYVPPLTGGVGSVGVYGVHFDYSKALAMAGIKVTLTSAGEGKTDGNMYEPYSDAAQKRDQAEIDRLYGLFLGFVSAGRGKTIDYVRKLGAYCFTGSEASIAIGYADVAGTSDQAWFDLATAVQAKPAALSMKAAAAAANAATTLAPEVPKAPVSVANLQQEDTRVSELNNADAGTGTPPNLEAITAQAAKQAREETSQINNLCIIAGCPQRLSEFIGKGFTVAQVQAELMAARVAAAGQETQSQVLPGAGTQDVNPQALIEACKKVSLQQYGKVRS